MRSYVMPVCLSLALAATAGLSVSRADGTQPGACASTAEAAYKACRNEALDDFWTGNGKCLNEPESAERAECQADNRESYTEFTEECGAQRDARDEICDALGQAPYDPEFERANFVNPDDIGGSVAANPYLPLIAGRTLVYKSADEDVMVAITHEKKKIDGVWCRVVRDTVTTGGELVEDTVDWMAQDIEGNVWYCGEGTAEYEDGLPVSIDGSFQAGADGARPGILMKAAPAVGDVYRQEFDLGNAEDSARVVSLHGSASTPAATCNGDCVVTRETTPLEPDAAEKKFYKSGVGEIMTLDLVTGGKTKLIKIIDEP